MVSVREKQNSMSGTALPITSALIAEYSGLRERQITFKKAAFPSDLKFLASVYASTRADEMAMVADWTDSQKTAFLDMQFKAQHTYYQEHYADAEFLIIRDNNRAIGRLYIERWDDEFRIIDIALLGKERDRGIGTVILSAIQSLAQRENLAVRIHVEHNNPAMRLYRRLGFTQVGEVGIYLLMEWGSG